ncbi:hypothetical protein RB213_006329 [Colletotrichum asianum]
MTPLSHNLPHSYCYIGRENTYSESTAIANPWPWMTPVTEFRRGEPCPISLPANPPSFQQAPEVCLVECRNWDQAANGTAAIRSRLIGSPIRVEGRRNGYIELALAESYIPIVCPGS